MDNVFSFIDVIADFIQQFASFLFNFFTSAVNVITVINTSLGLFLVNVSALPAFLTASVILAVSIGGALILGRVL